MLEKCWNQLGKLYAVAKTETQNLNVVHYCEKIVHNDATVNQRTVSESTNFVWL